jgi:CRP-like cAMP-binding protein
MAFLEAFRAGIAELGRLARVRSLLTQQRQLVALGPRDLDELTLGATTVAVGQGETIVSVDDLADAFYVVKDGMAIARVGGEPTVTYRVGDSFGEVGVFRGGVRRATVVAERPTELVRIEGTALLSLFGRDRLSAAPLEAAIDEYLEEG